jgi:hypothetical protein
MILILYLTKTNIMNLKEWVDRYKKWFLYLIVGLMSMSSLYGYTKSENVSKESNLIKKEDFREKTIKELNQLNSSNLNELVKVDCNDIEFKPKEIFTNLEGETEFNFDTLNYDRKGPVGIRQGVFSIISKYDEFENCYTHGFNQREFMDKFLFRDITLYGKIVKWNKSTDNNNIGLKVIRVETRLTFRNIWTNYPYLVIFLVSFLLVLIYRIYFHNEDSEEEEEEEE